MALRGQSSEKVTRAPVSRHQNEKREHPGAHFFSVLRPCGSRQVVAHCCADKRIIQMHILCPSLGSRKWSADHYAVRILVRPKRQETREHRGAHNTKGIRKTKQQGSRTTEQHGQDETPHRDNPTQGTGGGEARRQQKTEGERHTRTRGGNQCALLDTSSGPGTPKMNASSAEQH